VLPPPSLQGSRTLELVIYCWNRTNQQAPF
jgi:hypothetical protein